MGPTLINSDQNHKIINDRDFFASTDIKTNGSSNTMTANMYRVGDYVYFETSSTAPYQIRRIEELIKSQNGNVEAKVTCFYRRKDLAGSLTLLADKHQIVAGALEEEQEREVENLDDKEQHQLRHRELFLSRQMETLPATHIRGKCSVTLLNETEALTSYLKREDMFFYLLVFDPQQKTILADRGEIRIGPRFQADVPPMLISEKDDRKSEDLEELIYSPNHTLTDRQIDQFLVLCRSVGTFARALDCSSSVKQPSLHMSAAAASRDITLFQAMSILHKHGYDIGRAVSSLVPAGGPLLCRDEMEEWSASEANLFEEALDRYGKDFADVRRDFLPWKSLPNLIEYYYMWKTTDRYVQQKRVKAVEAESKLKQVYIPTSNKPGGGLINGSAGSMVESPSATGRPCESCTSTTSSQWYAWGVAHTQCRLCQSCWLYWKKFGGLKYPSQLECLDLASDKYVSNLHRPSHRCNINGCAKEFKLKSQLARHCAAAHGVLVRCGSPRPVMKTRAAFLLVTPAATRLARRLCARLLRPRHLARCPFQPVNAVAVRQECETVHGLVLGATAAGRLPSATTDRRRKQGRDRGKVVDVSHRLGTPNIQRPKWLDLTPRDQLPQPEHLAFPTPPKGADGQFVIRHCQSPVATPDNLSINNVSPSIIRGGIGTKRPYDYQNGGLEGGMYGGGKRRYLNPASAAAAAAAASVAMNVPSTKELLYGSTPLVSQQIPPMLAQYNGRAKVATITRVGGGRKHLVSWVDAPDDVYFVATEASRKLRRQFSTLELRRSARHPCKFPLNLKVPTDLTVATVTN